MALFTLLGASLPSFWPSHLLFFHSSYRSMFFAALGPGTWPSLCLECLLLTATSLFSEPHCFLFPSGKYKDSKATPYYRTSAQPTVFVLQVQICLLIAGWAVGFLRQDIFVLAFGVSSAWDDTLHLCVQ